MRYRVIVVREDGAWLVDIPEAHGAFTESEDLSGLDRYVREVVTLAEDLPASAMPSLEFEWVFEVSDADMTVALGPGWTLADLAATLNVPVERVVHAPPRVRAAH